MKWFVLLLCVWGLWTGVVHAAGLRQMRKQAGALYQEGKALALQHKYQEANQKFLEALGIVQKARTLATKPSAQERFQRSKVAFLLIIGRTYQLNRQFALARKFYQRCLQAKPPPKIELQARRFLQTLPAVEPPLGQMVALRINALPMHASISLHNAQGEGRFGRIPFIARIKAGIYQIEISAAGYVSHKDTLYLKPGTRIMHNYELERKGRVAKVRKAPERRLPPPPAKSLRTPLLWACAGLAGAALVTGVVLMGISSSAFAEANQMQQQLSGRPTSQQSNDFYDKAKEGSTLQGVGAVMMVVTGFAGAGALMLWLWPQPQASTQATTAPPATPQ